MTESSAGETPPVTSDDDGWKRIRSERDRANRELREASKQVEELAAWKAEREALEAKAAEEREIAKGDYAKAKERHKQELAERDEKLAAYEAKWAALETTNREGALLDRIVSLTGATDHKVRLRALLREAAVSRDVDIAPEDLTDAVAKNVIKILKDLDPGTFTEERKTAGNTRGSPTTQATGGLDSIYARVQAEGGWTDETRKLAAQELNKR
jgi:hypothetical protein